MRTLKPFARPRSSPLQVSLGDMHPEVAECLGRAFADVPDVEVVEGNLLDLDCDAIVSPANSFGDMGGGIDKAIDDFHKGDAQRRVMEAISREHFGELPVGAALIVRLEARRFPFVVASPTMRIPGSIAGTINAYASMRAALVAVLKFNAANGNIIRSLAIPGLGTGVGAMPYNEAATQMRVAYDNILRDQWRDIVHPAMAPFAFRKPV